MVIAARSEDNEVIRGRGFESRFTGAILELAWGPYSHLPGWRFESKTKELLPNRLGGRVIPPQKFRFDFFFFFFSLVISGFLDLFFPFSNCLDKVQDIFLAVVVLSIVAFTSSSQKSCSMKKTSLNCKKCILRHLQEFLAFWSLILLCNLQSVLWCFQNTLRIHEMSFF